MKESGTFPPGVPVRNIGARVERDGVRYRVWAPDHREMGVVVERDARRREIPLIREDNGYWSAFDPAGQVDDLYQFRFPDGRLRPDVASRFQPQGVHGPSACIDPGIFQWSSNSWTRPRWTGQTIYEIHVGTFTPAGTFRAAIEKLDHVRELGIDAIELMPLADFAGERNWGYDGVALYAPARCYGRPDDLRALVDAAHARGLAVVLDVVYNHLGPAGNYLSDFHPGYFRTDQHTPWGTAFHLDGPLSRPVRDFIVGNAAYWLNEFRFDGLRLDATHAIPDKSPRHLIGEIAAAVHALGGFVIAEDDRNDAGLVGRGRNEGINLDALWADDFHHQIRVGLTGTRDAFFRAYQGTAADIVDTLAHGWTYRGQPYEPWKGRARGTDSSGLSPDALIVCIENHDQVGNRANGERLEHLITPGQFRAASLLVCLTPYPPMIFMGQEWAAGTPFLYFTDHGGELGQQISAGRQREFEQHGAHWTEGNFADPESPGTFEKSKLRWEEVAEKEHAAILVLYRTGLEQRRLLAKAGAFARDRWEAFSFGDHFAIRYRGQDTQYLLLACLKEAEFPHDALPAAALPPAGMSWRTILTSGDPSPEASGRTSTPASPWQFPGPGAVLLQATPEEFHHAAH